MNEHDELSQIIFMEGLNHDRKRNLKQACNDTADKILAAGYRRTILVGTPEEADQLPTGTIIRDAAAFPYEKVDNEFTPWASGAKFRPTDRLNYPIAVLYVFKEEK